MLGGKKCGQEKIERVYCELSNSGGLYRLANAQNFVHRLLWSTRRLLVDQPRTTMETRRGSCLPHSCFYLNNSQDPAQHLACLPSSRARYLTNDPAMMLHWDSDVGAFRLGGGPTQSALRKPKSTGLRDDAPRSAATR